MSVRAFAEKCGLPESTVYTILKKGAGKANVNNVIAMCKTLGITVEQLDEMSKGITSNAAQILLSDNETEHLHKYRSIDNRGKHTVDTVLEMEYIRCDKPQYTDEDIIDITQSKKKRYIPTEEDIHSLVARNGKKMTRDEAIEFISAMYDDEDDDE